MPTTTRNIGFSQLRVGIFVLFGLAVLAFLILNSTGDFNPFERKLKLKARYATADGLREGSEVQLAGVHIGKVDQVKLMPADDSGDAKIEATLVVDEYLDGKPINERIRTDSVAQLISMSLLANDKLINITPGSPKGTPVKENDVLNSAGALSISQLTQTGNDLLGQINKLAVPTSEILEKANRGEGTLGKVINDEALYKNLDNTVNEARVTMLRLQSTLDKVNSGNGSAGKLLNDPELYNSLNRTAKELEGISKDLRSGRGTAGKLLYDDALYNDSRAAIQDLRNSVDGINRITADLNAGKGTAGKFLKDEQLYTDARDTLARFNSTAAKLDSLITDAQAGKGTVGKLLTDETLYNNLNQTTTNINQITTEGTKLIYDFRQNPKKYLTVRFSIF